MVKPPLDEIIAQIAMQTPLYDTEKQQTVYRYELSGIRWEITDAHGPNPQCHCYDLTTEQEITYDEWEGYDDGKTD